MTDLPDDEPQPGSRAWMEQTAQLDSAMATARRYLSALNAQDHPACNAILVELACDRDGRWSRPSWRWPPKLWTSPTWWTARR